MPTRGSSSQLKKLENIRVRTQSSVCLSKDTVTPAARSMKFEIYRDLRREYRWRLKASNGRITADSGEGYVSKTSVTTAIARFKSLIYSAQVVDLAPALPWLR